MIFQARKDENLDRTMAVTIRMEKRERGTISEFKQMQNRTHGREQKHVNSDVCVVYS